MAAKQCDGEARGTTTKRAINLGNCSTKFTKRSVNSLSFSLCMFSRFPSTPKSIDVTMRPKRTKDVQLASI